MAIPVCGNNPQRLYCEATYGGFKRLAHRGTDSVTEILQTKNNVLSLVVGSHTVVLRNRTRDAAITTRDMYMLPEEGYACNHMTEDFQWHMYDPDLVTGDYSCGVKENYKTIDTKILYMDLRNDFVLVEEETDSMEFDTESGDNIQWIDNGVSSFKHSISIADFLPYSVDMKNKLNNATEVSETTPYVVDLGSDLYIALPWGSGQPKNAIEEEYLLYNEITRNEFGGHEFYYPRWIHTLGLDHTDDIREKDEHLALIDEVLDGEIVAAVSYGPTLLTGTCGSAAHDISSNCLYSYKAVTGSGEIRFTGNPVPDLDTLLKDSEIAYPIGIS